MKGYRSPSEMLKHKILSKRKLHAYLKTFSSMGFLIRKRLPRRGNYVEYHLNSHPASQHPIWRHFFCPDSTHSDDYGPQLWDIPLLFKSNIEKQKWLSKKRVRKKLQADWKKQMKPMRSLAKVMMRSSVVIEDKLHYLRDYQLLHDLAPHKPEEAKEIIILLKDQIICPQCLKQISLQKYLQKGRDVLSYLMRIPEENKLYCSKCNYEESYGLGELTVN